MFNPLGACTSTERRLRTVESRIKELSDQLYMLDFRLSRLISHLGLQEVHTPAQDELVPKEPS